MVIFKDLIQCQVGRGVSTRELCCSVKLNQRPTMGGEGGGSQPESKKQTEPFNRLEQEVFVL